MNIIEPSQLLEMILSQQNHYSRPKISLSVRTFNKMADELTDINLTIRFGYSDFIEFIESHYDFIPFKEHNLYISFSEDLLKEVRHYNRIYQNIDKLISIKDLWQNYLK